MNNKKKIAAYDIETIARPLSNVVINMFKPINIIFYGPPGPVAGRFVEVETDDGKSIKIGEWIEHVDGSWALRITSLPKEVKNNEQ